MSHELFVVSRPNRDSNVGSNLSSLAGATWLARRLSATLVVDWRGQQQLRDRSINYFSRFFATPQTLGGIRTLYAPVDGVSYAPGDRKAIWIDPYQTRNLRAESEFPPQTRLVLQPYHGLDRIHPGPQDVQFRYLRHFYRDIRPNSMLTAEIDKWADKHLRGAFVVGVNIRTGNGAYFGKGSPYAGRVDISIFRNSGHFLRVIEAACRSRMKALPKPLRDSFVIFYATDSSAMSELLSGLPNAVTRRTVFPPLGAGDLYAFDGDVYSDEDGIHDTLADMFLLAHCDALVYNSSLFNQYARISRGFFGGNQIHIESLFTRPRVRQQRHALHRRLQRRLPSEVYSRLLATASRWPVTHTRRLGALPAGDSSEATREPRTHDDRD